MTRRAKFLLACFIAAAIAWLCLLAGLITATVFAIQLAIQPSGWMFGIWFPGGPLSLGALAGLVMLGSVVWEELG